MKKHYLLLGFVFLIVVSAQIAMAAPPWKTAEAEKKILEEERKLVEEQRKLLEAQQTTPNPDQSSGELNWEMIAVVLGVCGAIVGWLISRKVRGKTAKYMSEIDKAYRTYNKNANKCEAELASLREKIEGDFKKGKINDNSLSLLEARIDKYSENLRSEIIDKGFKLPPDLNKKIKHMLSDGIITKEEYEHFSEIMKEGQGISKADQERLKALMKRWKDEDKR